ncbi:3-isopropylmalate dehydratase small subunit [Salinarimonas sp. NSM]|uniref:3-isopropylmalate dehydratase small subunit n=1 Tax=Salinarimonas sp. NSM TaxID=3458003 RepID=UPI00403593BF
MTPFTRHEGTAVGLPLENVDTDQIIPARFMSTPRSEGYGRFLLHDLRHDEADAPRPDFPLNRPEAVGASVLVARRNFGGGSSREAAVYALVDAGIRAVLAPSFGDIFSGNAVANGLLPARLEPDAIEALLGMTPCPVVVDLDTTTVEAGGRRFGFEIDPVFRVKLLNGWDDIDLTASWGERIAAFTAERRAQAPWLWRA